MKVKCKCIQHKGVFGVHNVQFSMKCPCIFDCKCPNVCAHAACDVMWNNSPLSVALLAYIDHYNNPINSNGLFLNSLQLSNIWRLQPEHGTFDSLLQSCEQGRGNILSCGYWNSLFKHSIFTCMVPPFPIYSTTTLMIDIVKVHCCVVIMKGKLLSFEHSINFNRAQDISIRRSSSAVTEK